MDILENDWSDDEDIVEFINHERRPYKVSDQRPDHFEKWDDTDFVVRFRLTKNTVLSILELVDNRLETPTDRNHAIRPIDQLLLTLRFYATGSFLITMAEFYDISRSSVSNIIKRVSNAIASLSHTFIKMPENQNDQQQIQLQFYEKALLPRVIGSLDCTHVKIQSPGGPNAELFRNRKGYFSINVQTVASANLKILDIVARWPGSCHDQTIFDNSAIKRRLENNEFGNNTLLVADSGYGNNMHVITPLIRTRTEVEEVYNEAVTRTRNPVERQYGVWKRRFPILSLGLRLKLETTLAVIVATAVLHNIALNNNENEPPMDPEQNYEDINFDEDYVLEPIDRENVRNARDLLLADYVPGLL
ncbi:putative nuclease HARBI1 [Zophobas morio]|uniref:putative nuclease HARBI1 n=1 Tax=Zophobas morio TaxID=2755281 RepID=UPI003082E34D